MIIRHIQLMDEWLLESFAKRLENTAAELRFIIAIG